MNEDWPQILLWILTGVYVFAAIWALRDTIKAHRRSKDVQRQIDETRKIRREVSKQICREQNQSSAAHKRRNNNG